MASQVIISFTQAEITSEPEEEITMKSSLSVCRSSGAVPVALAEVQEHRRTGAPPGVGRIEYPGRRTRIRARYNALQYNLIEHRSLVRIANQKHLLERLNL